MAKDAAIEAVRPLNATQSRNLQKLVKSDFETMRIEIDELGAAQRKLAKEQVEKAWAEKGADAEEWEREATELLREQQAQRDDLKRRAAAAKVQLKYNLYRDGSTGVSSEVVGLQAAITEAVNAVTNQARTAYNLLRRKEIEAERKILVASITAQAEDILASIPSAKELMAEALTNTTSKEISQ